MKRFQKCIAPVYITCAVFVLLFALLVNKFGSKNPVDNFQDTCITLSKNWQITLDNSDMSPKTLSLPDSLQSDGVPFQLTTTLPDNSYGWKNAPCLLLYTYYSDLEIYLDQTLIYQYSVSPDSFYHTVGTLSFLIPLPQDWEESELTIRMIPTGGDLTYSLSPPVLGLGGDLIYNSLRKDMSSIVLVVLLFILGSIMTVLHIVLNSGLKNRSHQEDARAQNLLWLGMLCITSATYFGSQIETLHIFIKNAYVFHILEFTSLAFLCVPGLMLSMTAADKKLHRYYYAAVTLCLGNMALQLLLRVAAGVEFRTMLLFTHAMLILTFLVIILTLVRTNGTSFPKKKEMLITLIPLISSGLLEVISFYVFPAQHKRLFLKYGILFFTLFNALLFIRDYFSFYTESVHTRLYRRLAYSDIMTGLQNRQSYEACLNQIRSKEHSFASLCVLSIDLNNLKTINDTKGHSAGDRLICKMAACLKQELRDTDEIFRTGGDEFIALLYDCTQSAEEIILRLRTAAEEIDPDIPLDFAAGSAYIDRADRLDQAIVAADWNMYKDKARRKQAMQCSETSKEI